MLYTFFQQLQQLNKTRSIYFCLAFILLEFILFKLYVMRNVAFFYPVGFDQTGYLLVSYKLYENIKQYGFFQGLLNSEMISTGFLFPLQSLFFYLLFGASRFIALVPNFIYFASLQVIAFGSMKSISKENTFAIIFLGLTLSLQTTFMPVGNI